MPRSEVERYFDRLYVSAMEMVRTSPVLESRPEVDAVLADAVAMLDAMAYPRPFPSNLYVAGRMFVEIARRSGSLKVHSGCRYLAEELGVDWSTANGWCRELAGREVITLVRRAGGWWPHTWQLSVGPPTSPRGGRGRGVGERGAVEHAALKVPCLEDPIAADVFGPYGWFGTRGLGFVAWRLLILVESESPNPVPIPRLTAGLGALADKGLNDLEDSGLIVCDGAACCRGPATLEHVARTLRTLGSKTWRRARHMTERRHYRAELDRQHGLSPDAKPAANLRKQILTLAEESQWPNILGVEGESAWRAEVSRAPLQSLRNRLNALRWWCDRRSSGPQKVRGTGTA